MARFPWSFAAKIARVTLEGFADGEAGEGEVLIILQQATLGAQTFYRWAESDLPATGPKTLNREEAVRLGLEYARGIGRVVLLFIAADTKTSRCCSSKRQ